MVAVCRTNVNYMHHNSYPKTQLQRKKKKKKGKMTIVDYLSLKVSLASHIELLQFLTWPSIL
jgi:hypothetical protein